MDNDEDLKGAEGIQKIVFVIFEVVSPNSIGKTNKEDCRPF